MSVRIVSTIDRLAADLAKMPVTLANELQGTVREGARVGNSVARDFARQSAGRHGRLYPGTFTTETRRPVRAFGAGHYSAVYGPDASKRQGGMEFEFGSRNQPPHLDLAKSADLIGPTLAQEVRGALDRVFWP